MSAQTHTHDFETVDAHLSKLRAQSDDADRHISALRLSLAEAEERAGRLRAEIKHVEALASKNGAQNLSSASTDIKSIADSTKAIPARFSQWPLTSDEYERYGRQLILPEIGAPGQSALKHARILIVGLGGLGCPAAAYLAGAGPGILGLMDGDIVETSNLHRQVAHNTGTVGLNKAESARRYLVELNPLVEYKLHPEHLTPENALSVFEQYDIVLDCTDHPTSRYLISDTCVIAAIPLVSASALKTDGQLIILNNPPHRGPCYRCVFPTPPPPETLTSCGEGGILGPVVGTMGVLQALEAIKVITSPRITGEVDLQRRTSMLMFSAYGEPQFRTIKMRGRKAGCIACSEQKTITRGNLSTFSYSTFCGLPPSTNILSAEHRISPVSLSEVDPAKIVDVRDRTQFAICSLQGSVNIPWTGDAEAWKRTAIDQLRDRDEVFLICRLGNDSQLATQVLATEMPHVKVVDVTGGFRAWKNEVDHEWPDY